MHFVVSNVLQSSLQHSDNSVTVLSYLPGQYCPDSFKSALHRKPSLQLSIRLTEAQPQKAQLKAVTRSSAERRMQGSDLLRQVADSACDRPNPDRLSCVTGVTQPSQIKSSLRGLWPTVDSWQREGEPEYHLIFTIRWLSQQPLKLTQSSSTDVTSLLSQPTLVAWL